MLSRGSSVLNLYAVACAQRFLLSFSAVLVVLPRNAVAVFRTQDIAPSQLNIGRRPLVISWTKANRVSQLVLAVFVCAFKSALIAVVSTSIGFGHGVLCSFSKVSGLRQSHGCKHNGETGAASSTSGKCVSLVNLKRRQGS